MSFGITLLLFNSFIWDFLGYGRLPLFSRPKSFDGTAVLAFALHRHSKICNNGAISPRETHHSKSRACDNSRSLILLVKYPKQMQTQTNEVYPRCTRDDIERVYCV